ncbi:MAG: membrane protein insertase YidC [Mediterranea sp.]|nr:membrane protein insertase YidC [Mediterranea sp.]
MDKNTITGLVLIALLLIGFSWYSRPSEEQLQAQQHYYDSIAQVQKREAELKQKAEAALANERQLKAATDSTALFFAARQGEEKQFTIENDLIRLTVDSKGGRIASAIIKNYMEQDKVTPVSLFSGNDASMNFLFYNQRETIQTADYIFTPVAQTDTTLTMRLQADATSYIDLTYTLQPGSYLVQIALQAVGMADKLSNGKQSVDIEWQQRARQIEKGYTYENRLAELTYKLYDEGTETLSAASNEEKEVAEPLNWIAFKNQFFSAVLISDAKFTQSKLSSQMESQGSGYIKSYRAEMSTPFDPTGAQPTLLNFYLGPNHYKTLSALDRGRDHDWDLNKLVYLGWPIIRWVNLIFTINLFDWLTGWGLSMGIVLLLMTLIVKIVIYPTTWKTYISSAKMRVLKPKIDAINQKYPKQEDAMKKQQEVMALYSQYGVSPMGGCLPMLIQMPVIMALFFFVPSAIELRQQSFLWADDLSTYDALITFPHIPFLGDHISIFCLLMTVTTILNTKYMMQQQDNGANPQMAAMKWMQYLMPLMFFFILNDYPAGLNYYYFLSTLIGVVTTIVMRRTTDEAKLLAQLEANKKDPKKMKKTGFAARLEAMQKQQEELMRQREQQRKG